MTLGYTEGDREPDLLLWILRLLYFSPALVVGLPILVFLPNLLIGILITVIIKALNRERYMLRYSLFFAVSPLLLFLLLILLD